MSDILIPQDIDYPGLELNIDREQTSQLGLTPQGVVDNVITALTSDGQIAPSYWIDPKTGNNYMVTVQYFNQKIDSMTMSDFKNIPLRAEYFHEVHAASVGSQNRSDQYADRSRSLSDSPRHRHLRYAHNRRSQRGQQGSE